MLLPDVFLSDSPRHSSHPLLLFPCRRSSSPDKHQKSGIQLFYEVDIWPVLDGTTFIRHFVTKTHSFRDKIASGQRSKTPSQTSIMANYMHLKGGKELNIIVIICIYVN